MHGRSKWLGWSDFGLTTFCRLNLYVCTLNTCKVVRSKSSLLGKWLPNFVHISLTKRQHCVGTSSHFGVLDGHFLLHVHSLYGESEITSLISQAPSIFAVHILPATEVWESGNKTYSFGTQDQNPVCMPVITAKKQFLNNFFLLRGHAFHM